MHVKIVSPPLQVSVVAKGPPIGFDMSMNMADVRSVFIAVLNLKTTAADGDTPVAPLIGVVETIVGWANAWLKLARQVAKPKKSRKLLRRCLRMIYSEFITATPVFLLDRMPKWRP